MIKMFEIQIESFSEQKGYFLDSRLIHISLPDNTVISKINVIDNKERTKYLCETIERIIKGG